MGRKKLLIKRLECVKARQSKYSKRKTGILKKAKELSVLCDVDVALVMFSPSGKPSVSVGKNNDFRDLHRVVERLSIMSVEDRKERRQFTMKLLKKIYTNTEVDPRNFSLDMIDLLKLQQDHLKETISQKTKILNEWKNPHTINDLGKIQIMEDHLLVSIDCIRAKKENEDLHI